MGQFASNDVNDTRIDREPLPVPSESIFDAPYYGKRINASWWRHVSGMVSGLTELSAWDDTPSEVMRAVSEISAFINRDFLSMTCDELQDCFDSSPVLQALQQANFAQSTKIVVSANENRWQAWNDGGNIPTAINPIAQDVFSSDTQETVNWLCVAFRTFMQDLQARMKDGIGLVRTIGYVANALTVFTTTIAGYLSPMAGVLGGIVVYFLDIANDELDAMLEAFSDDTALESVVCCVVNAMHEADNTYENYLTAISADCYDTDSHEEKIAYWLNQYCANERIYAYFVDLLAQAQLCTLTDDCNCIDLGDGTWEQIFDFTASAGAGLTIVNGTWSSGNGYAPDNVGSDNWYVIITKVFAIETDLTYFDIEYNWTTVRTNAGITHYTYNPGLPGNVPEGDIVPTVGTHVATASYLTYDGGVAMWVRQSYGGDFYVRKMTVRGIGTNPF